MKFTQEFLEDVMDGNTNLISEKIIDQRRWVTIVRIIFKFKDKYYVAYDERGSTENQDGNGFGADEDGNVECDELEPFEKTIITYRNIRTKKEIY